MVLRKEDLEMVVQDYPTLLTQMLKVAHERLEELGEVSEVKAANEKFNQH